MLRLQINGIIILNDDIMNFSLCHNWSFKMLYRVDGNIAWMVLFHHNAVNINETCRYQQGSIMYHTCIAELHVLGGIWSTITAVVTGLL